MVGFFEPGSYPWASRGLPGDAEFTQLPEDWDHLGPFYEKMMKRLPVLAETGIRLHFCGPESFTPDGLYHLGEAPGLRNFFVAAGFNSVGFLSGPGAGSVLADWIVDGRSPLDLPEADPRRVAPHEANRRFLEQRVTETLDVAYEIHWPYQQRESARGLRRSPLHDRVAAAGAVFGELLGWERANWYAPSGVPKPVRVRVRAAELVRALGPGAPGRPLGCGAVRHLLVREAAGAGPGRAGCAAAGQRGERGGRAGPDRLHPVAQRPWRHRERRHRDPAGRDPVPGPVRAGHAGPGPRLAGAEYRAGRVRRRHRRQRRVRDDPGDGACLRACFCSRSPTPTCPTQPSRSVRPGKSTLAAASSGPPGSPTWASSAGNCSSRPTWPRHVYDTIVSAGFGVRAAARGLPRPRLAADGEGLPFVGPRRFRRGHAAGGRALASPSPGTSPAVSPGATPCSG